MINQHRLFFETLYNYVLTVVSMLLVASATSEHRSQMFAHARVVRRSRRTSTDDDDSTSLPMVVACSDTSLVGILHNFHCEHCRLLCFLALVLDCDNNSCKDI